MKRLILVFILSLFITSCSTPPPQPELTPEAIEHLVDRGMKVGFEYGFIKGYKLQGNGEPPTESIIANEYTNFQELWRSL